MKIFIKICLFLILVVALCFSEENINLTAEKVVYDKSHEKVFAERNVVIKYKEFILNTEKVEYDVEKNIIFVSTEATLFSRGDVIKLSKLVYDVPAGYITADNFATYIDPYYSFSKFCMLSENLYTLKESKVTHCDIFPPHYHLASKEAIIYPDEKIVLKRPQLKIKEIPVLWLPYYTISLKPVKDRFVIEPGYDSYNGFQAKTKYSYSFSEKSVLSILVDLYSYQGVGSGIEYKYFTDKHYGVMYGYYIHQQKDKKKRWNLMFNNVTTFSPLWKTQTQVEFLSDEQMYYYYLKENWFLSRREVSSNFSLVRDSKKTNFRISYLRKDKYLEDKFVNETVKFPLSYIVYPVKFAGLTFTERFSFTPSFVEGTTYYNILSDNELSCLSQINISRELSCSPNVKLTTKFTSSSEIEPIWYNIYNFHFPVRHKIRYGYTDLSYQFGIKSENNSFKITVSTTNIVEHCLVPKINLSYLWIYFRASTLYNFLYSIPSEEKWYERFSPLVTDVGIKLRNVNFNFHNEYDIRTAKEQSLQVSIDYNIFNNKFSVIYGKNFSFPERSFISASINISLFSTWQLKIHSSGNLVKDKFEILNSRYEIYKDLHCWEARLGSVVRKDIYELWCFVGLKFKPREPAKIDEVDKQFLPWRM